MTHVWVRTIDGDLIRASTIRQINTDGGLRAILNAGSQFILAPTADREAADRAALELVAALALGEGRAQASVIEVACEDDQVIVSTRLLPAEDPRDAAL